MAKVDNPQSANSTRLSLFLDDLPLTPFGMKVGDSTRKKKLGYRLKSNIGDIASNCASKSPLQKNKKSFAGLKENFPIPKSTVHVNKRRRRFATLQQNLILAPPLDESDREVSEINDCGMDRFSEKTKEEIPASPCRRESIYTDIDDGSFVEFVEHPIVEKVYNHDINSFYTCSNNENATQYSTSSKKCTANVGFRKYVHKTVEKEMEKKLKGPEINKRKTPFLVDETIISSSNMQKFCLNSTALPQINKRPIPEITDISSVYPNFENDCHYSSSENICLKPLPKSKSSNILDESNPEQVEYILIEDSDEEKSDKDRENLMVVELEDSINENEEQDKLAKRQCCTQKSLASNNYPESSVISEDISIASSSQICNSPINHHKKAVVMESSEESVNKTTERHINPLSNVDHIGKIRDDKLRKLPLSLPINDSFATKEMVSRWVATSPFKESSFGSSFLGQNKENHIPINENDNGLSQELRLRLSGASSGENHSLNSSPITPERPRNFIFDLCRVAESPDVNEYGSTPPSLTPNRNDYNSHVLDNKNISKTSFNSGPKKIDNKLCNEYRDVCSNSDDDSFQFIKSRDKRQCKNRIVLSSDESDDNTENNKKPSTLKLNNKNLFLTSDESSSDSDKLQNICSQLDKIYNNGWRHMENDVLNSNRKPKIRNETEDSSEIKKREKPVTVKKKYPKDSFLNDDSSEDGNSFYLPLMTRVNEKNRNDSSKKDFKKDFNDKNCTRPVNVDTVSQDYKVSGNNKLTPNNKGINCSLFSDESSGLPSIDSKKSISKKKRHKNPKFVVKKHFSNSGPPNRRRSSLKTRKCSFLASLELGCSQSLMHPDAIPYIKNFKKLKQDLAEKLYSFFNENVFENKLPRLMSIKWNARMRTTAGFCYYQMDSTKPSGKSARIELSPKVIDTPSRLRDTLIHELCHAASWIISGYKEGHGPLFKAWASLATARYPELPQIKTCHSYHISYKFTYKCSKCGYRFGRHSKSLDIERKICGHCRGSFEVFLTSKLDQPTVINPGKGLMPAKCAPITPRAPNAFSLFVKENYSSVKKSKIGIKHGDVMKELGAAFSKTKI